MTRITRNSPGGAGTIFVLCLTAVLLAPSIATADSSTASSSPRSLVGAWLVQVTLRNCDTKAPLGPPFHSLVSFHRGGTLSEAAGSLAFAPGQRTPGHGTWAAAGRHTYQQEMVAMLLFETPPNLPGTPTFDPAKPVSPGFKAGWATVSHTVRVVDADHIASEGTNAFYDADGAVYRTGCSTATGTRF